MNASSPSRREFVKLSAVSMFAFGGMGTFLVGCGSTEGSEGNKNQLEEPQKPDSGSNEPNQNPTELKVGVEYETDSMEVSDLLRSKDPNLMGFVYGLYNSSVPVTDGYNSKGLETVLLMMNANDGSRDGEYASKWDDKETMTIINFDEFAEPFGAFFDWDYKSNPDAVTVPEKALQAMQWSGEPRESPTITIVSEPPLTMKVKVPIACCTAMSKHIVANRYEDAQKAYEVGEITEKELQSTPKEMMFEGYSHNDMLDVLRSPRNATDETYETYKKTLEYTLTITDDGAYQATLDNPDWWKSAAELTDPNETTGEWNDLFDSRTR